MQSLRLDKDSYKKDESDEITELRQAKEHAEEREQMLYTLVSSAMGNIGQDFFDTIVTKLAQWLNVECVLIGGIENNERVHASPMYLDGKLSHNFSYELANSPCELTSKKGFCAFPERVIELFPKDQILVDINAEGYMGVALYNKDGEASGVICAVSRSKINAPPFAEELLRIVGDRVTAELERQKAEKALIESEAKLRESNTTKDKFFSLIAHDLKSPFNALLGLSELLHKNYDNYNDDKRKHFIEHITISGKRINNLLENLLAWAYHQQGKIDFKPIELPLKKLLTDSVELTRSIATEKGITITESIDGDANVVADRNMIQTVLRNLLSNAIKFTPTSGKVKVTTCICDETNRIRVTISDNGVGIPPERLNNLFNLNNDMSTLGTNSEKGTGLGLIICKEFIERHESKLHVESIKDEGSCFSFTLKRAG